MTSGIQPSLISPIGLRGPEQDLGLKGKPGPEVQVKERGGFEAMAKVAVEEPLARMQGREAAPTIRDIVVIGRGSSAAAYLRNLEEAPTRDIVVVGMSDPWAGARGHDPGHYTKNINQAEQLIDLGQGPVASRSQDPVDRLEKASVNAATILDRVGDDHVVEGKVTSVREQDGHYVVRNEDGTEIHTNKVVYATGAGIEDPVEAGAQGDHDYHHVPREVQVFRTAIDALGDAAGDLRDHVMDLDTFQNDPGRFSAGNNQRVAILGPNAGTDAIMEAATRNYAADDVFWMMGTTDRPGTALTWDVEEAGIQPSFTAEDAVEERPARQAAGRDGGIVRHHTERGSRDPQYTILPNPDRTPENPDAPALRISYQRDILNEEGTIVDMVEEHMDVDFFVYAAGQRGDVARSTLTPELYGNLEVAYDTDQRYARMGQGQRDDGLPGAHVGGAHQHATGLHTRGTTRDRGIEIVGAAATQTARGVEHSFLDSDYVRTLESAAQDPAFDAEMEAILDVLDQPLDFADMVQRMGDGNPPARLSDQDYRDLEQELLERLEDRRDEMGAQGAAPGGVTAEGAIKELLNLHRMRDRAAREYHALGPRRNNVAAILSAGLARATPATTGDNRLIGGLNRNAEAHLGAMRTDHITDASRAGINFLEDQTTIALFIAEQYQDIPGSYIEQMVGAIIDWRTDGDHLRGFSPEELDTIDFALNAMNADFAEKREDFLGLITDVYPNIPQHHAGQLADELTQEFGRLDFGGDEVATFNAAQHVEILERLSLIDGLHADAAGDGGARLAMAQSARIGRLDHLA